jgi:hypothetical protein
MDSLFDALNLQDDSDEQSATRVDWSKKSYTAKEFADLVVNSREFRQYIFYGISTRDLPQSVLCRILDHAWGKPVERMEVTDKTNPFEGLSVTALKDRLARLQSLVHELESTRQLETDDDDSSAVTH